ncbi:MAG TPA: glucosamine-6-phosphate deaminase [Bacteroides sp.]|nr:glucosamine-6-phosphate deaminase [Bacteroides sp.]
MQIVIAETKQELGQQAARRGGMLIREAIQKNGEANIILATGASQFEMLDALLKEDIEWSKITAFHLDEYIGLPESHGASFRKYLKERVVDKVDLKKIVFVDGEADPIQECERLGKLIGQHKIHVAFIGIGENAHLAFNDPPADFETEDAFITVNLDRACREQQLGEGWFKSLNEVPSRAISMSIKQILKSETIICSVPDARKSDAVDKAVNGDVTPDVPATILQKHDACWLFLDYESASLLHSG